MAITDSQRELCRLIARRRAESGESYVAGGVALNTLIAAPRVSRDIDLFHDTREALAASFDADRALLLANGYSLEVRRERPTFVEAVARKGVASLLLQWVCDSAYRFYLELAVAAGAIAEEAIGDAQDLADEIAATLWKIVGRPR